MRLAGKEFSLPRMPAGKWQESQKEGRLRARCRAARPASLPAGKNSHLGQESIRSMARKRPLDHALSHLFGPFSGGAEQGFLFAATRITR
jgi:hypothetical protein